MLSSFDLVAEYICSDCAKCHKTTILNKEERCHGKKPLQMNNIQSSADTLSQQHVQFSNASLIFVIPKANGTSLFATVTTVCPLYIIPLANSSKAHNVKHKIFLSETYWC